MKTRREALKHGLALVGAAGTGALLLDAAPAGAAEGDGGGHGTPTSIPPGSDTRRRNLSFTGAGVDVSAPDFVRGTLPAAGQRLLITGSLVDSTGRVVGQVLGTYLQLVAFGDAGPTGPVSLQDEVLSLEGGTLCARGLGLTDLGKPVVFAVTGGTGLFARRTGSFTAVQQFLSLGGDGSARFDLSAIGEAPDNGS